MFKDYQIEDYQYRKLSNNFVALFKEYIKDFYKGKHHSVNENILFHGFPTNRFEYFTIIEADRDDENLFIIVNNEYYAFKQTNKPYNDKKYSYDKLYKHFRLGNKCLLRNHIKNLPIPKACNVYTHRLIASMLRPLKPKEEVHHIKKPNSTLDNHYENLLILPEGVHTKLDNKVKDGDFASDTEYYQEIETLKYKYRNRQAPLNQQLLFKVAFYKYLENKSHKEIILNIKKTLKLNVSHNKINQYLNLVDGSLFVDFVLQGK